MPVFKDATGKEYIVSLNIRKVKMLKELGMDIMAQDGSGLKAIADDACLLCDCLYRICVDDENITQDEFLNAMHGDSIEAAANAMIEAVIDFFPQSRRNLLKRAVEKSRAMQEKMLLAAAEELEAMD